MRCAVKIEHSASDAAEFVEDLSTITGVSIQRRIGQTADWVEIRKIPIITSDDLNFTLMDYSAKSMRNYEYRNVINTDTNYVGSAVSIETRFDGILIATKTKYYVSIVDPQYTLQRDFNVAYVRPFNSKYPHAIHNGATNYNKGTIEGCFNPLGPDCSLEMKYGGYADELVDFLSNGTPKLVKTFDGHAWYVEVDTPVKRSYDKVIGLVKINFSWTEIGDLPVDINQLTMG